MDTGRDAVLQPGLCSLKDSSSYQDVTVWLWWSFKRPCRTMWLPRELFPSGVKQSWRAGKLSKNSFSPQSLAEQAFCVYLLASGQSSHTCARVRAAPLVCQEFCGILQHFCTFGAVWVIFFFFLRVTASSTASWCVSGRGGTQDRNCYLSVSFRNIHEEEITPNIFLLNQQIGIERTAFLAWYLIYVVFPSVNGCLHV